MVARCSALLPLLLCVCRVVLSQEPESRSIKATDIESKNVTVLGKTGLPIGTVFTGRLTIAANAGKGPQVQIAIPSLGQTISFDQDLVQPYALHPEDMEVTAYDGKDVVAYETLVYFGYPGDFWKGVGPLVSPPRNRSTGFYTMLILRLPEVRPGRVPR